MTKEIYFKDTIPTAATKKNISKKLCDRKRKMTKVDCQNEFERNTESGGLYSLIWTEQSTGKNIM